MKIEFSRPSYWNQRADIFSLKNKSIKEIDRERDYDETDCTKWVEDWIARRSGTEYCVVMNSCTSCLESAALLLDLRHGDEVILPSFTFVTTASAFVRCGAKPVFVDIDPVSLNLDLEQVERSITSRTKAMVAVHYAGISCNLEKAREIANKNCIVLIQDGAQALGSTYANQPVAKYGDICVYSFHDTKNISCGEGGAIVTSNSEYYEKLVMIRDKGTNRKNFLEGVVDKYTWRMLGSSYEMSSVLMRLLRKELERFDYIQYSRGCLWNFYQKAFGEYEELGLVRRMKIEDRCVGNSHMYFVIARDQEMQKRLLRELNDRLVVAQFHYIPLHSSSYARDVLGVECSLPFTEDLASRLIRLPMWSGLYEDSERMRRLEEVLKGIVIDSCL